VSLPPRSQQLVDATPVHHRKTGASACIEFTLYADGHAGIAVSRIAGQPPNRQIVQADSLPLNSREELEKHIAAVVDLVEEASRRATS
jgi:hypothetical protein